MTPRRRQRLVLVGLMVCAAGAAVAFGLNAFRQNIMLFHAPSDVAAGSVEPGRPFRIGGMVVEGSIERGVADRAGREAGDGQNVGQGDGQGDGQGVGSDGGRRGERQDDRRLAVRFEVTDTAETVPVVFAGILPDLFREGQGVVAMGELDANGTFVASEVLAKHDENYMPPEVAEALDKAGRMPGSAAVYGSTTVVDP